MDLVVQLSGDATRPQKSAARDREDDATPTSERIPRSRSRTSRLRVRQVAARLSRPDGFEFSLCLLSPPPVGLSLYIRLRQHVSAAAGARKFSPGDKIFQVVARSLSRDRPALKYWTALSCSRIFFLNLLLLLHLPFPPPGTSQPRCRRRRRHFPPRAGTPPSLRPPVIHHLPRPSFSPRLPSFPLPTSSFAVFPPLPPASLPTSSPHRRPDVFFSGASAQELHDL